MRDKIPDTVTLMQYLREEGGYSVQGGGKLFHGASPYDPDSWDHYNTPRRSRQRGKRDEGLPEDAWAPWGPLDVEDSEMFDVKNVNWAISELKKSHDKPFFLADGPGYCAVSDFTGKVDRSSPVATAVFSSSLLRLARSTIQPRKTYCLPLREKQTPVGVFHGPETDRKKKNWLLVPL